MGCLALSYYEQALPKKSGRSVFLSTAKAPDFRSGQAAQRCPQGNAKSCAGSYKFGFNGQEKVNEIAGIGNHTTALFWEYDTRIARRWNLDPVDKTWQSPFSVFSNDPIAKVDPYGDDDYFNKSGKLLWRAVVDRNHNRIQIVDVDDKEFMKQVALAHQRFDGNIERMNSWMRAWAYSLAEKPMANKNGAITEHGIAVSKIAHFYKQEMGLNQPLNFQFQYDATSNASTTGPPYETSFSLDPTSQLIQNKDLDYVGNFKNIIVHEYSHPYSKDPGYGSNNSLYHLYQYRDQVNSSSWNQTTDSWRNETYRKVGRYLNTPGKDEDRKSFKKFFENKFGGTYEQKTKGGNYDLNFNAKRIYK